MPSVTIDAGVLAAPPEDAAPDVVYHYVETLLDWPRLLVQSRVAIYMSQRAPESLFEDGLYPLRDALRQLFASKGIREYDANTVAQVVDRLLQLTPTFEAFFRLSDVLAESVSTDPDILAFATGESMSSDLARCVVLIAILREHCRKSVPDHSLILRRTEKPLVKVKALIHDLEHDREDLFGLPSPPEFFEGTVLVCDSFRGLINNLDDAIILDTATDEIGMDVAVRIALYKSRLVRGLEPEWEDIGPVAYSDAFFSSLKRCCTSQPASFARRALRAIVETMDGLNLSAVHALRTGKGGGDSQRTRGEDKAWRRDIDYEYHLHYWECDDGTLEMASVVAHNDFSIPG